MSETMYRYESNKLYSEMKQDNKINLKLTSNIAVRTKYLLCIMKQSENFL